ncbi:MAG: aminotransferase class IV [Gemmatimonadota bacterium]|jgi:D-alanine transaminase
MPDMVYFNGAYLDRDDVRISPDDRGFLFADGIYEVVRFYGGRPFELEAHMERMRNGLAALRIEGVAPDTIPDIATQLLSRNGLESADAILYLQVTRGAAPRVHHFPDTPAKPTVFLTVRSFTPSVDPAAGCAVITAPDHRWTRCDIKSISLLPNCMAAQDAHERDAHEAVLVRDGVALEGTRSSFFAVIGGEVRTAPRSNYILPGITRAVALELCTAAEIPSAERPVLVEELRGADELFLAGTTTEILPIVKLDGEPVGSGRPGPIASRLAERFRARTEAL